jgi:hypothetical protein
MRHNQRSHAWEGSSDPPENIVLTRQNDFSYRLVRPVDYDNMTMKRTKSKKQPTVVRIPTYAFGYTFTHIPEYVREDVETLERESALYADHWIEELNDFRHVRIVLSPEEAKDYARRSWAYELWIRAGQPKWARDVPQIDADIAHDADTYSPQFEDGTVIPPPHQGKGVRSFRAVAQKPSSKISDNLSFDK